VRYDLHLMHVEAPFRNILRKRLPGQAESRCHSENGRYKTTNSCH
jgi:hypothetical protein